ncbi:hypothetical protein YPPY14_3300, partial [Yersinia pestis PY-14]
MSKSSEFILRS